MCLQVIYIYYVKIYLEDWPFINQQRFICHKTDCIWSIINLLIRVFHISVIIIIIISSSSSSIASVKIQTH